MFIELKVWLDERIESCFTIRKEKQLIELLFIDCCSLDEVAVHFDISKAGVKKRGERSAGKTETHFVG